MKLLHKVLLVFLIFSIITPQNGFAKEKDFYKKHKKQFDKVIISESYLDTIKSYDSETNEFNCGMIDVDCRLTAFQLKWATGLAIFIADGTKLLVLSPDMITKDNGFVKYKNYLQGLSTGLLVLFMLWQIMAMMMRRFGDPDDYPSAMNQKLLNVFVGAAFLGLYQPIFDMILTVQHDITSAIISSGIDKDSILLMMMLYTPKYSIFFTLFIGIINIVFLIALVYRFVALGFFYVVGPAAIPTIVNEEFNYFSVWWRYIINNIVTLFAQSLCFTLSLASMTGQFTFTKNLPAGIDVVAGFLLSIVFCFFALVIPSILGNLGSSTGTGRTLGRIARYAVIRR